MEPELIIVDELLQNSRIEPSFIILLENEGLINITIIEGRRYMHESQISELEKFANLYYELSINIEGIDVIHNLLSQMNEMKSELFQLRKLLNDYKKI